MVWLPGVVRRRDTFKRCKVTRNDGTNGLRFGDVNPLVNISGDFRKKLLEERDAARRDSRLKARFLSYRLNVPSGDEAEVLLTVDDFERMTKRDVPPRSRTSPLSGSI